LLENRNTAHVGDDLQCDFLLLARAGHFPKSIGKSLKLMPRMQRPAARAVSWKSAALSWINILDYFAQSREMHSHTNTLCVFLSGRNLLL
jgi:hypothetical protein